MANIPERDLPGSHENVGMTETALPFRTCVSIAKPFSSGTVKQDGRLAHERQEGPVELEVPKGHPLPSS